VLQCVAVCCSVMYAYLHLIPVYGVAKISRLLKIMGLCRI